MVWEKYEVNKLHQRARSMSISTGLNDALKQFIKEKGMSRQQCFDIALTSLWRIWNNNSDTVEPASAVTEIKVRHILIDNLQPKDTKNDGKKGYINIHFKGDKTFAFINELEKLYMIHGTEDGVRRILSWFLREEGYLEKIKPSFKREPSKPKDIVS